MDRNEDKDLIDPPIGGFKVKIKDANDSDKYLTISGTSFTWADESTIFGSATGNSRHLKYSDTVETTYYAAPNSNNTGLTRVTTTPATQWSLSNGKLQYGSSGNYLNMSGANVTVDTTGSSKISFEDALLEDVPPEDVPLS